MKILSTLRAGRVIRQSLYSPKDPNPNQHRRTISISAEDKKRANLKTSYEKLLMLVCANFAPGDWWVTLTYTDDFLPGCREESRKYWRKFMRWYRKYRKDNKDPLLYRPADMLDMETLRTGLRPAEVPELRLAVRQALEEGFRRDLAPDEPEEVNLVLAAREEAEKKKKAQALQGFITSLQQLASLATARKPPSSSPPGSTST